MPRYIDTETGNIIDYNPPPQAGDQLNLAFVTKPPYKTLKLQLRDGISLVEATQIAYNYISNPRTEHNRVEFKFGECYVVVARLKRES